jgi:GNAT superfamily N-acetyltransferase
MSDFEIAAYDRNDCLLCRQNGIVVGQVCVRDLRDESFAGYVIWNLLVFPEHREKGIAEALIECVIETYDDAKIFISAEPFYDKNGLSQEELRDWYLRLGFKIWQSEQNSDGKWLVREPTW